VRSIRFAEFADDGIEGTRSWHTDPLRDDGFCATFFNVVEDGIAVIVVAFEGCFLDCAVHPLDLPVGLGVLDLGEPVFDPVFVAAQVEHVRHAGR
jgi:hypothetical protein